jgi:methionine-rich copper-binding protein CopC
MFFFTLFLFGSAQTAPSLAHTSLISQIPVGNSTIESLPEFVELTFDESLIVIGDANLLEVTSPSGKLISVGKVRIINNVVTRDIAQTLEQGKYLVDYRVVSEDGHVVEGQYSFKLKSNTSSSPQSAPSDEPSMQSQSPMDTPEVIASPSTISETGSNEIVETEEHTDHSFFDRHDAHIFLGIGALSAIYIWWKVRKRRITSDQ